MNSKRTPRRGRVLSKQEQDNVLALLYQGWGKTLVCRKLGFSYQSLLRTAEQRPDFARAVREATLSKDEAVEMALYKAALEGNVSAQTFWLKRQQPEAEGLKPSQETHVLEESDLSRLNDQELIERARAAGIDLPPKVARRLAKAYRVGRSGDVPEAGGD